MNTKECTDVRIRFIKIHAMNNKMIAKAEILLKIKTQNEYLSTQVTHMPESHHTR